MSFFVYNGALKRLSFVWKEVLLDETETESAVVKQIVGAIALVVSLTAGVVALLLAEAWLVSTLLSIAFGVECMNLWALAGLLLLFNLSVSYRNTR